MFSDIQDALITHDFIPPSNHLYAVDLWLNPLKQDSASNKRRSRMNKQEKKTKDRSSGSFDARGEDRRSFKLVQGSLISQLLCITWRLPPAFYQFGDSPTPE